MNISKKALLVTMQIMRPFILFVTLLFAVSSFSQNARDTTIEFRTLDSIKTVIYKLKDSLRRLQYENSCLTNCFSVDTLEFGKDSMIIKYKSHSGKLLKVHTKKYLEPDGLYNYEKTEYFDRLELPEFIEHWEQARSSEDEQGRTFQWKVYSYERFKHDSIGRTITWIKFYPAFSRRTVRRYDYLYNSDGIQTSSIQRIEIEKFWD